MKTYLVKVEQFGTRLNNTDGLTGVMTSHLTAAEIQSQVYHARERRAPDWRSALRITSLDGRQPEVSAIVAKEN